MGAIDASYSDILAFTIWISDQQKRMLAGGRFAKIEEIDRRFFKVFGEKMPAFKKCFKITGITV